MTVETSSKICPQSEAPIRTVRVIVFTMKNGANRCEVFLESNVLGAAPHTITKKYLQAQLGRDIFRCSPPTSFIENARLSALANEIFQRYQSGMDIQSALERIRESIFLAMELPTMPPIPIE